MKVVSIGEILIDFTMTGKNPQGIPQCSAYPGGAPANLSVTAAKLGADSAFIGKVGNDALGHYLIQVLHANGVDTSGVLCRDGNPTTLAVVSVDDQGERDFSF